LNGEGRAVAFIAERRDALFFHTFMQRSIDRVGNQQVEGSWSDLESTYGYSGPLTSSSDPEFIAQAWESFDRWCQSERVVAEFIRFSPLLRNESLRSEGTMISHDRDTVAVRLDVTESELWQSYRSVQRNMIRKALALGLVAAETTLDEGLAQFRKVYRETMHRLDADAYFLFSDAYFAALRKLAQPVRLFEVRSGEDVAAAGLFLVRGRRIHYHLSGSADGFRSGGATNLLLHAVATWGVQQGFAVLHLGGGRTADTADPLLRFKSAMSPLRLPFFTGRRVHDVGMYGDLCSLWLDQVQPRIRPKYFLLYRLRAGA
jgi:hypothetical protein